MNHYYNPIRKVLSTSFGRNWNGDLEKFSNMAKFITLLSWRTRIWTHFLPKSELSAFKHNFRTLHYANAKVRRKFSTSFYSSLLILQMKKPKPLYNRWILLRNTHKLLHEANIVLRSLVPLYHAKDILFSYTINTLQCIFNSILCMLHLLEIRANVKRHQYMINSGKSPLVNFLPWASSSFLAFCCYLCLKVACRAGMKLQPHCLSEDHKQIRESHCMDQTYITTLIPRKWSVLGPPSVLAVT